MDVQDSLTCRLKFFAGFISWQYPHLMQFLWHVPHVECSCLVPSLSVVVLVICITLDGQTVQACKNSAKKSLCASAALGSACAVVPDSAMAWASISNSASNMACCPNRTILVKIQTHTYTGHAAPKRAPLIPASWVCLEPEYYQTKQILLTVAAHASPFVEKIVHQK